MIGASFLAVTDVTVRGNQRLTLGEIDALIGHVRGESLLLVNLERFRATLLDSPWVADVTIRRVFPATVDVRIVEREPVAVARIGQQLYLVDGTGVIIDDYGPQYKDFDLPIVDGLAAPRTVDGPSIDPGRAALTARFLNALAPRPELIRALSQVDVKNESNIIVLLGDDPTYLHLGDELFLERIQTYLELTPALAERERAVDYVDLRFGNRVFLKDRK
jgi:cell division protein FtsQ